MKNDNIEDRIAFLKNEIQQIEEEMETINDFIKEKDPQSYEDDLEYWMKLKKDYDYRISELQKTYLENDVQKKYEKFIRGG